MKYYVNEFNEELVTKKNHQFFILFQNEYDEHYI